MDSKSGSQPSAPDPNESAAAQGAANERAIVKSAEVNQINQKTPFASLTYSGDVGSGNRTQTLTLDPRYQAIADQLAANAGNSATGLSTAPFNLDGIQEMSGSDDYLNASQPLEQAAYDRAMLYLEPDFQRDMDRTMASLDVRGLPQGGEAWQNEVGDLRDSQNMARTNAALDAVQAGRAEQSRLFGIEQAARQQGINERVLERTQPINEIAAALGGSPAMQNPNFTPFSQYQIAPGDIQGATALQYQAEQNAANNRAGVHQGLMGGAFGLGQAAIMRSDRRVKKNIKRVGTTDGGTPVYTFRYRDGGPVQMGVMAQDMEKVNPAAVVEVGGVKHVDYGAVI